MFQSYLSWLQQLLLVSIYIELFLGFLPEISSLDALTSFLSMNRYPFVVLIKLNMKKSFCTGALLSPTWVLTAGHCVTGEFDDSMRVYVFTHFGTETLDFNKSNNNIQERTSNYFRVPYSYAQKPSSGVSDLALINLKEEFEPQPWLKTTPILPIVSSVSEMKCQVVGYNVSKLIHLPDRLPPEMYLLEYNILVKKQCLNNVKLVIESQLKYRNWICQLDKRTIEDFFAESGVLLFCEVMNNNTSLLGVAVGKFHTIHNVISSDRGNDNDPLVFTDICPYLTWLRSIIGPQMIPSPGRLGADCYLPSRQNSLALSFCTFCISLFTTLLQLSKFNVAL